MSGRRVLLISANTETSPAPVYPVALARLAGALEKAGHQVRQYDVLADTRRTTHGRASLPQVLQETQPDLIGISIRNIDNADADAPRSYIAEYRQLVDEIRAHQVPRGRGAAPIVLGGSGFSLFARKLMGLLGAEFGIVGPGEQALRALCDGLGGGANPSGIPNLLTADSPAPARGGCGTPKGSPMFSGAAHDPDIVRYYWRQSGMIGIQTHRGCPKQCTYCVYPVIEGHDVQWGDPVELVDEMARMVTDWDVRYFFMADSLFNLSREREVALAEEIRRRSLSVSWGAFFAPTRMDRGYLESLQRSGLKHVEFGTDSFSEAMLRSYAKDFTVEDALAASSLCAELGIFCAHYILFGGPGENADTIRETLRNVSKLQRCVLFPFVGVRLYPGTPLHALARQEGRAPDEDDCLEPTFYFADGLDGPTIWQLVGEQVHGMRQWVVPSRHPPLRGMMERLREWGVKGPLWEFLLK